jgi:hypothetical protein
MKMQDLSKPFRDSMVQDMYQFSARLHKEPDLPTTAEEMDFYVASVGAITPSQGQNKCTLQNNPS